MSTLAKPPIADIARRPPTVRNLGIIGLDSSHVPEFTRRIHAMQASGDAYCRVTTYWTDGDHHMPTEHVDRWRQQTEAMGVLACDTRERLLDRVSGVLVLSVNGHLHLGHALPALERGLPTYIDKPLACDLASARQILDASRKFNAPCYSASSLRFATELAALDRNALGEIVAVDAYGPGELNDAMPRLLYYGVHTVEMVDAIWGPGVKRVRASLFRDRDVMEMEYHDGRYARLRLERKASYAFGATVHGTQIAHDFQVDFAPVYSRLVAGMTRFFEQNQPPVPLRDIVENIAVLEAAQRSADSDGGWVEVEHVD